MRPPSDPAVGRLPDDPSRRRIVVLAGGDPVTVPLVRSLPADAMVIAADSGLAAARTLGLDVDLVVGDLDSVDPDDLDAAEARGVPIDRHPVDKNRTDLAIALDAARDQGPGRVTVVGGHGGRLDHLLANALLLASPTYAELAPVALMGPAVVTVVRGSVELAGRRGELVSLLPAHGAAERVTTRGLAFGLHAEDLPPGSSRGVSNVFDGTSATVEVAAGVVVAVQPGDLAPHPDAGPGTDHHHPDRPRPTEEPTR